MLIRKVDTTMFGGAEATTGSSDRFLDALCEATPRIRIYYAVAGTKPRYHATREVTLCRASVVSDTRRRGFARRRS